jgi:hypothetical protein
MPWVDSFRPKGERWMEEAANPRKLSSISLKHISPATLDVKYINGVKPQHSTFFFSGEIDFLIKKVLFHFLWVEKGDDPETAEATMEGLAFPSSPSRAAGSEEAGRRSCLSFPANARKIKAGKRVLRRREGGIGNGVKNPVREQGRFWIVSQAIFPTRNGRNPKKRPASMGLKC